MHILTLSIWLLAVTSVHGQGSITYLSCLNLPAGGSKPVASDAWLAQGFYTGTNSLGYTLDSVELLMANASGTPSGLSVSLYSLNSHLFPDQLLWSLVGPSNPRTAGIYSYTASGVMLAPQTHFFIVANGSLPSATGSYAWQYYAPMVSPPFQITGGWWPGYFDSSVDGLVWQRIGNQNLFQFAVTATPVPEPSGFALFGLGGLLALRKLRSKVNSNDFGTASNESVEADESQLLRVPAGRTL